MVRLDSGCKLDDGKGVEGKVQKARCTDEHEDDVVPRHGVHLHVTLFDRVGEEADEDDHRQKRGESRFGKAGIEQRHADTVQAENNHDRADSPALPALPHARVGLTVVFAHQRVEVCLRLAVKTGGHLYGVLGVVLVGGHKFSPLKWGSRIAPRQGKCSFGQLQLRQEALPQLENGSLA